MKYLKKRAEEEIDSEGSWAISYGDMITLLLSFFVIFFSADFKKKEIENTNKHLSFDLGLMTLGEAEKGAKKNPGMPMLKLPDVKVHTVGESLVVTFGTQSFFESGSTDVRPEAKKVLEHFVSKYLPYAGTYQLSIKGFTDKRKVLKLHRKYEDNLELSVLRSVAAMRVLQKLGIPLKRMEIAGVGEMKSINKLVSDKKNLSQEELNSFSRTIVLVVKPERENWL